MSVPLTDSALPGLSGALDTEMMSALLSEALEGAALRLVAVHVLKHKPGRRCAIAYHLDGCGSERKLFAKAFHTDRGASIFDGMIRVAAALAKTPIVVPKPVAYVAPLKLLVTEYLEGERLSAALYAGTSEDPARRMAQAIAALHRSGVTFDRSWTVRDELDSTRKFISALEGRDERRAVRLLAALERRAEALPHVPGGPIHRDFYPDQLWDCGGRTALLDLDDMRCGDPALDLGNCAAHLTLRPLQFPELARGCGVARGIFLAEYLRIRRREIDEDVFLERVRFYEAASLLRLSGVYGGRPDWAGTIPPRLLDACDRLLREGRS